MPPTSPSTACGSERGVRRGNAQTTIGALLVGRSFIEAVLFAAIATAAQVFTAGDRAIPIVTTALALAGVGIVLASILRDARADRQNTAIALVAMAAAAAAGVSYAPPHPDGLMILTRLILFGIVGEAFVWRNLTVARSLARWSDARSSGFAAIGATALVALLPGAVDRTGLVIAGLVATAATGVALSLARSAEELSLAGREAHGDSRPDHRVGHGDPPRDPVGHRGDLRAVQRRADPAGRRLRRADHREPALRIPPRDGLRRRVLRQRHPVAVPWRELPDAACSSRRRSATRRRRRRCGRSRRRVRSSWARSRS